MAGPQRTLIAPGTPFTLEVTPSLPPRLARLAELADDLWYAWDRPTRNLFARLDPDLWRTVGQSPKALLRQVDEQRLVAAADDPVYLTNYSRVLSAYDTYLGQATRRGNGDGLARDDLVAYFCAEFGFHESLPIYSGGLGILAGDHCKAASDARLPFVGVGLLYRQGYFFQSIDHEGKQHATYHDSEFESLPVRPALDAQGGEVHVNIELPGRELVVKVWRARVGHVALVLLDTDVPPNSERDRAIAHRLYGGDRRMRIEQEIVLGVGGVRALAALGYAPTVWHINEGHAAFLVLERVRALVRQGREFATALEAVAGNTVFTTHTAVPGRARPLRAGNGGRVLRALVRRHWRRAARPARARARAAKSRVQHDGPRHPRLAAPQCRLGHSRGRLRAHAGRPLAAGAAAR